MAEEILVPAKRARRTRGPEPKYAEETEGEERSEAVVTTPKKRGRAKKALTASVITEEVDVEIEAEAGVEAAANGIPTKPKRRVKKTNTTVEEVKAEEQGGEDGIVVKKVKRKRKTKEEKEAEAMPLAARSIGTKLFVGAHVSSAGGKLWAETPCSRTCGFRKHIVYLLRLAVF